MKILLNDGLAEEGVKILLEEGLEVSKERLDSSALAKYIQNVDALIVRSATKVTREIIKNGAQGNLKIIGRAGVGYDNIDIEAATENGIVVKFAPYGNTNSAAELALGLMIATSRNIPQAHTSAISGIWQRQPFFGIEITGKTLGIIGCGRVGQRLSELVTGFHMDVIGYDSSIEHVKLHFPTSKIRYSSLEEVLTKSHYISLHTGGSKTLIGERELSMMRKDAILINTSRGSNVNENALYTALKNGTIKSAGLDVYEEEPDIEGTEFKNKLRELKNVVLSMHLGASTEEAQKETAREIATVVSDYLKKGDFSNSVNAGETIGYEKKQIHPLFIYHKDLPGAFAAIDRVLADYGVNIREISSRQLGNGSAMAVYSVHQPITEEVINSLQNLDLVLSTKI
ncbi:MAG: phosphoglycerate dehydrogenase [Nanoarchaeota archaeon]|nr:phosphoglycerate dehydrogenase [Nanoarchaeota archaeon]